MDGTKKPQRVVEKKRPYSAYDRALIAAKEADIQVEFFLGAPVCEKGSTEDVFKVLGKITVVDIYCVEVDWEGNGLIWLTKSGVIGTRILK